jgi:hypothetical protein
VKPRDGLEWLKILLISPGCRGDGVRREPTAATTSFLAHVFARRPYRGAVRPLSAFDESLFCRLKPLRRGGYLRSVYHGENGLRTLKELARSYLTISKDLTRVMNRVKALRSVERTSAMGLRDIYLLIATYGLRFSEVVAITLDDIRWRQGSLRIRQSKTSSPLELPLTNEVSTALVKHLKRMPPPSAVSPHLSENARSHRSVETYGDQGSFFTLGSEQRRQDSLPGRTLSASLAGGSFPEERNIPQDHRRGPRASFRSEHLDLSTTGHRGLA